ncbi:MAG TPA: hypothetical protein VF618_25720 [Thermoanaerobaculia bacterium]
MSKTSRVLILVVLLLSVLALNVSASVATEVATEEAAALPCYDMWTNCKTTHSAEYCEGMWCGCMKATYGSNC